MLLSRTKALNEVLSAQKMANDKGGPRYTGGASISKARGKVALIKPIGNNFMPFKANGGKTLIKKTTDASVHLMPKNKKSTPIKAKKQGAFLGKATTRRGEVNSLKFKPSYHCGVKY